MNSETRPRPAGPRAQARERTLRRIVELGNAQLLEQGAAELSVREIARGLGMVSSAIYRYVASRDELLTLLIVDAYGSLADAVDAALAGAGEDPRERFLALGSALTTWAVAHPERWTLLYGTPVRGYSAPSAMTNTAGTRVIGRVLEIAAAVDAQEAGARDQQTGPEVPPEVAALVADTLHEFGVEARTATALRAVTAWSSMIGVISAHVFGQLGPEANTVGEAVLAAQIEHLAQLAAPA